MKTYSTEFWLDPRVTSRLSLIQGQGGFAREIIRAGEVVVIIGGTLMSEAEFQAFQANAVRYDAIQVDEDQHLVDVTGGLEQTGVSLNHSCDSNLWMRDENTLVARRDILTNEEVTIDYALFTTQPDWQLELACRCGSPLCRHIITGNDWQRPELQTRYRDHFSPFINLRITR